MACIVGVIAVLAYSIITPVTDSLVGGEFVGVPKLADKAGCTAIQSIYISLAVTSAVTGHSKIGIAFIEKIRWFYFRIHVGVDRCNIQIARA